MKKAIFFIIYLLSLTSVWCQCVVKGGQGQPFMVKEDVNNKIYVYLLNSLSDAEISFTSNSEEPHLWYKYNTNISEAIPILCQQNGKTSSITDITDGYGYFVKSPNDSSCVWIINYNDKQPVFHNLDFDKDEKYSCDKVTIIADVETKPLEYITKNGTKISLPRTYHLLYDNLKWNENELSFDSIEVIKEFNNPHTINIDAPLKNTVFTLIGDEYAKHFGMEQKISTPYEAVTLEAHAKAIPSKTTSKNEQTTEDVLGGSAPVEINFTTYSNEPTTTLYIWKIYKINPPKDSTLIVRYPDKSINYTFEESGEFIVQLEVNNINNNQTACSDKSQKFNIFIRESDLQLPNIFSPGTSIGINDKYKVSYKSLISFKASIYNRWGNLLYHWENPSEGWDGKVNGCYVPTGVYFIIVEAKGADGIIYKKSSDINILR